MREEGPAAVPRLLDGLETGPQLTLGSEHPAVDDRMGFSSSVMGTSNFTSPPRSL
jgi:hypothetical protein